MIGGDQINLQFAVPGDVMRAPNIPVSTLDELHHLPAAAAPTFINVGSNMPLGRASVGTGPRYLQIFKNLAKACMASIVTSMPSSQTTVSGMAAADCM
jgi:hypothetical protein